MNNSLCHKKRITDPSGIWDPTQLIGAHVAVKSMPVSNNFDAGFKRNLTDCIVKKVYYRISTDGKAITVVELAEIPEYFFTLKDLEFLNIQNTFLSICGVAICGNTICGFGIDKIIEENN